MFPRLPEMPVTRSIAERLRGLVSREPAERREAEGGESKFRAGLRKAFNVVKTIGKPFAEAAGTILGYQVVFDAVKFWKQNKEAGRLKEQILAELTYPNKEISEKSATITRLLDEAVAKGAISAVEHTQFLNALGRIILESAGETAPNQQEQENNENIERAIDLFRAYNAEPQMISDEDYVRRLNELETALFRNTKTEEQKNAIKEWLRVFLPANVVGASAEMLEDEFERRQMAVNNSVTELKKNFDFSETEEQRIAQALTNDTAKSRVEATLDAYVKTKVTGMQVARQGLNTLLVASGLNLARAGVMLTMRGIEGARKAWAEHTREVQAGSVEQKSMSEVLRTRFVDAARETFSLGMWSKKKERTKLEVAGDVAKALGTLATYYGLGVAGAAEISEGAISAQMSKFVDAAEHKDVGGFAKTVGENFVLNAQRVWENMGRPVELFNKLKARILGEAQMVAESAATGVGGVVIEGGSHIPLPGEVSGTELPSEETATVLPEEETPTELPTEETPSALPEEVTPGVEAPLPPIHPRASEIGHEAPSRAPEVVRVLPATQTQPEMPPAKAETEAENIFGDSLRKQFASLSKEDAEEIYASTAIHKRDGFEHIFRRQVHAMRDHLSKEEAQKWFESVGGRGKITSEHSINRFIHRVAIDNKLVDKQGHTAVGIRWLKELREHPKHVMFLQDENNPGHTRIIKDEDFPEYKVQRGAQHLVEPAEPTTQGMRPEETPQRMPRRAPEVPEHAASVAPVRRPPKLDWSLPPVHEERAPVAPVHEPSYRAQITRDLEEIGKGAPRVRGMQEDEIPARQEKPTEYPSETVKPAPSEVTVPLESLPEHYLDKNIGIAIDRVGSGADAHLQIRAMPRYLPHYSGPTGLLKPGVSIEPILYGGFGPKSRSFNLVRDIYKLGALEHMTSDEKNPQTKKLFTAALAEMRKQFEADKRYFAESFIADKPNPIDYEKIDSAVRAIAKNPAVARTLQF